MKNKKIIRIILISLIFIIGIIVLLNFFNVFNQSSETDENTIEIVNLDSQTKMEVGDYLVLINTLYQKGMQSTKELNEQILLYEQGKTSVSDLNTYITQYNKKLTYYYLVAVQNPSLDETKKVETDLNFQFYLMRRGSEELLKFVQDKSTLRLSVGKDLLAQSILEEQNSETLIGQNIARYAIDANTVVIDPSIWDKEYQFLQKQPDLVIFKDLDSSEKQGYSNYLKIVNDNFMLVSWEIQHMYQAKMDYTNGKITADQLSTDLDKSGYIINNIYDEFKILSVPDGLGNLEKDVSNTMTMYHDAVLEIQKFRMSMNTKFYDNAMIMINQADESAARIGEFIYSVRHQYSL